MGRAPVAPAVVTSLPGPVFWGVGRAWSSALKYAAKAGRGFDGDDDAAVLPDVVEEAGDELASLGGIGLCVPEGGEVAEQFLGAIEVGVGRWREALEFFLEGLAAHDVAGLGEVAEDVEVLETVGLGQQLAAALLVFAGVFVGCGADRVEYVSPLSRCEPATCAKAKRRISICGGVNRGPTLSLCHRLSPRHGRLHHPAASRTAAVSVS